MAQTTATAMTVAEVLTELAALEDPRAREVNEKHGDDHGVNLGKLRAVAKRLKTQQENPHAEELRVAWLADPDPVVASAGWALTTERVAKQQPEDLDIGERLEVLKDYPTAPGSTSPFAPTWISAMVNRRP